MIDQPPKDSGVTFWKYTLMLVPLLWCIGFGICRIRGCDMNDTLMKAVTYTLSGLAGWLVYRLVWRTSHPRYMARAFVCIGMNSGYLHPTVPPWPFGRMLVLHIMLSILFLLLMGFIMSRVDRSFGIKPPPRSSIHPLSDDQIA